MNEIDLKKQEMLATTLDKLGIEGFPSRTELDSWQRSGKQFPTLEEFINANNSRLLTSYDKYNLYPAGIWDVSIKLLKFILLNNGFTVNDWIMLCPRINAGGGKGQYDLSALPKEWIKNSPLESFTKIAFKSSLIARKLPEMLEVCFKKMPSAINNPIAYETVGDFLNLFTPEFQVFLSTVDRKKRSPYLSMFSLQNVLRALGFDQNDGYFMSLVNPWEKTKQYYVNQLMNAHNFSSEDAMIAVDLGLKVGWITASDY
jgi:hypothetical protein